MSHKQQLCAGLLMGEKGNIDQRTNAVMAVGFTVPDSKNQLHTILGTMKTPLRVHKRTTLDRCTI